MGSKEAQAYDPILVAEFKSLGGQNKDDLKAMQTAIFTVPEATLQEQFKAQYPIIEGLVELTIAFHKAYRDMKQEQGIMDFSDLEHLCLALLVEPGTEDDPQHLKWQRNCKILSKKSWSMNTKIRMACKRRLST